MKIKVYGTRGSVPISNIESIKYGGNTTCLQIFDECIPNNMILTLDAGSGFVPMSKEIMKDSTKNDIFILFTHYHIDHTIGLFLSPITFIKKFNISLLGPLENDMGSKEMMENIMRSPYFPVDIREVKSHIHYKGIRTPNARVMVVHPEGINVIDIDHYEMIIKHNEYISLGRGKFPLKECLVIKMMRTQHPEKTLSYRFENMKTGKVFVMLTDHENCDGVSKCMSDHLKNADVLIADCQYSREKYDSGFCGFGHSTPDYVVNLAETCGVKKLGLTHHDPDSTDKIIDTIVNEAKSYVKGDLMVFGCEDYMEINL